MNPNHSFLITHMLISTHFALLEHPNEPILSLFFATICSESHVTEYRVFLQVSVCLMALFLPYLCVAIDFRRKTAQNAIIWIDWSIAPNFESFLFLSNDFIYSLSYLWNVSHSRLLATAPQTWKSGAQYTAKRVFVRKYSLPPALIDWTIYFFFHSCIYAEKHMWEGMKHIN